MTPRSKITTVAMAIALASGAGILYAQSGGQGGSSGSVGARDQTNDPLSNNNDQMKQPPATQTGQPPATQAADPVTGQPPQPLDQQQGQTATSSQNNGNNTTTEQRQDPSVRTQAPDSSMNSDSTSRNNSANSGSDSTLPARADRN
ncbi:hypothetical protein [Roseateles chitosanitabidus]|uniref:hypothetical protein n=1 Tax=Roseateles chitosanitabidus TaxID=65048 RepID=UPI000832F349|nr:hypothetical protein [Roseateles chitosanitabidus]